MPSSSPLSVGAWFVFSGHLSSSIGRQLVVLEAHREIPERAMGSLLDLLRALFLPHLGQLRLVRALSSCARGIEESMIFGCGRIKFKRQFQMVVAAGVSPRSSAPPFFFRRSSVGTGVRVPGIVFAASSASFSSIRR
jgi:hypothetical protein